MVDETSFGKILVQGRDAEKALQQLCANDVALPVGHTAYTGALNSRGTFESDFTVARLARDTAGRVLPSWDGCRTLGADEVFLLGFSRGVMQGYLAARNRNESTMVDRLSGELMDAAREDVLTYLDYPKDHWAQIASTNPLERLNKEIKRRADVVGIFPNYASITRLVGAMMLEQNDEWSLNRRCMQLEGLQTLYGTLPTRLSTVAR